MPVYLIQPPKSPLARALGAIIGALFLIGAFMLGFVAFLVAIGFTVVAGIVVWFRSWQLRRSLGKNAPPAPDKGGDKGAIEGEFHVVNEERDTTR